MPQCRTGVYAPADWDGALALRSSERPEAEGAGLELEFVYGFAGMAPTAANLYCTSEGEVRRLRSCAPTGAGVARHWR